MKMHRAVRLALRRTYERLHVASIANRVSKWEAGFLFDELASASALIESDARTACDVIARVARYVAAK